MNQRLLWDLWSLLMWSWDGQTGLQCDEHQIVLHHGTSYMTIHSHKIQRLRKLKIFPFSCFIFLLPTCFPLYSFNVFSILSLVFYFYFFMKKVFIEHTIYHNSFQCTRTYRIFFPCTSCAHSSLTISLVFLR